MKKTKLRVGIVGHGNITPIHVKSIEELDNCEFVALSSSSVEKRRKVATEHGVKTFADYNDMILQPEVDVIIICTPSGFHMEPTIAAANAKKHVITEKPLEVTVARCKEMIEACEKAGVTLSCIFQNRYASDYLKLEEAVKSGKLGKLLLGNAYIKWFRDQAYYDSADWRGTKRGDGGAVVINQGIHTIDLLMNIMGTAKSVFGNIRTLTHDIEGEDLATANIEFESGALGTIEASTSIYDAFPEKLEIHGVDGSVVMEAGKIVYWNNRTDGELEIEENLEKSGAKDPMGIDYSRHKTQLNNIFNSILSGGAPAVTGVEARKTIELIEGVYKSAESGEKVFLNSF
ncbi:MAG: Gfo/Idh/MocA family oxidoreductase [Bacteroidetes bacterium]|nr:Gfo/Idh/MocA family oxidoreductase [Bacteroidota bacterium]MDA1122220.1 Gfo/Idh/MocA family oxidoreductase [Bacteroidota bacterium]